MKSADEPEKHLALGIDETRRGDVAGLQALAESAVRSGCRRRSQRHTDS
ncbi:MAG: hypothetical protein U5N21_19750 [Rhodococcus sp. (in: high G+C Gram-positive bacteria)]|nr:hypothetical protein [Rhodococcus sp. (in: high G+C Gram-positive bacteria)]